MFSHHKLKSTLNQQQKPKKKQICINIDDGDLPFEGQLCQCKKKEIMYRQNLRSLPSHTVTKMTNTNTLMNNMEPFNRSTCILIEQYAEPVLLNSKRQMFRPVCDDQILFVNQRYTHHCRNNNRITIRDNISYRHYYKNFVYVNYLQMLLPGQLKDTLLTSSHGQSGKHSCVPKIMQEIRQRDYFPSVAKHVRKLVREYQTCLKDKRIDN